MEFDVIEKCRFSCDSLFNRKYWSQRDDHHVHFTQICLQIGWQCVGKWTKADIKAWRNYEYETVQRHIACLYQICQYISYWCSPIIWKTEICNNNLLNKIIMILTHWDIWIIHLRSRQYQNECIDWLTRCIIWIKRPYYYRYRIERYTDPEYYEWNIFGLFFEIVMCFSINWNWFISGS